MGAKRQVASPRIRGIQEQYWRACHFLQVALRSKRTSTHFRYLMAAAYPARAIVELMLEAVDKEEAPSYRDTKTERARIRFESLIKPRLPHYNLIERIRIHDFHRFGLLPPDPKRVQMFLGGPIRMSTSGKGATSLVLTEPGLKSMEGNPQIVSQRPLCGLDGSFWDDEIGKYIPLATILTEYLAAIPAVIADFERLLQGGPENQSCS